MLCGRLVRHVAVACGPRGSRGLVSLSGSEFGVRRSVAHAPAIRLQARNAGLFSRILTGKEKGEEEQQEQEKNETNQTHHQPAARPAAEALQAYEKKVPEDVGAFVKKKLAALRSTGVDAVLPSEKLSSLREKYLLLAECEEAFDEPVEASQLTKLKTTQDVVWYFETRLTTESTGLEAKLQEKSALPPNLVISQ